MAHLLKPEKGRLPFLRDFGLGYHNNIIHCKGIEKKKQERNPLEKLPEGSSREGVYSIQSLFYHPPCVKAHQAPFITK